jgi:exopolysaccharide production protein ExoQ
MNRIQMPIALFGVHLPPPVALVLTVGFVVFLFRRDSRQGSNVTGALWLPLLWLLISGSRSVTQWLSLLHVPVGLGSAEEGNPLDACVFFALIAAGIYVLNQRQINLGEVFQKNAWLVAFLLYCFIAIVWSDFPFVAFKRWIKILGLPIMALIVITEPRPMEALTTLMKRSAYVLIPFSVLLIKYYPDIGRKFDQWTGLAVNCGVAQSKNTLGSILILLGLFFFWLLLQTWRTERSKERRNELRLIVGFLVMIAWLFRMAQSTTALICLMVGISIIVLLGRRWVNKRLIGIYVLVTIVVLVSAQLAFGISSYALEILHKSPTLTDRTALWSDILDIKINPIFGVGFESFWLGDRAAPLWETRWWHPEESHNGYLEIYINLGLVGLFIFVGLIVSTFRAIRLELLRNLEWGRFRLGFLFALLLYNCTEVSFRGPHALWLVFYIIAIEYPQLPFAAVESAGFGATPSEERETELVYSRNEF